MSSLPRTRPHDARCASLLLATYTLLFANFSVWKALYMALLPIAFGDVILLAAIGFGLLALLWILFAAVAIGRLTKTAWVALVVLAAGSAYFTDNYGLLIDRVAVQAVFESDAREIREWASLRMVPYLAMAVMPILWIVHVRLRILSLSQTLASLSGVLLVGSLVIIVVIFSNFQTLSSLARNNRELPHLLNPTALLQAAYGYVRRVVAPRPTRVAATHLDAAKGDSWSALAKKPLLVIVVGESARAQSFSVFGYDRPTTPRLEETDSINFRNVRSCGTSTAVSLPCMFSDVGRSGYSDRVVRGRENVLDVLSRAGLKVLWLDNNTGSKNIAKRVGERSLAGSSDPRWCTGDGCFDEILVDELRNELSLSHAPDVVVLHLKGSHGPSYFQRYPPAFRTFTPTCDSNELEQCTREELINTYDNTIVYTDYIVASVIDVLKNHSDDRDSAVLYISDHGESTGEKGMYLHGAPSFMAPDEQTWIPMIFWASASFASRISLDLSCLRNDVDRPFSHDHFFNSILTLLDVRISARRPDLDVFLPCLGR